MYSSAFPYVLGILLAGITVYPAKHLGVRREQAFLTAIITVVAFGFVGFPIEDGDLVGFTWELGALGVFVLLIVLSRTYAVALLAAVFFAHGLWDLVYLLGLVPVDKPRWVVELCVPYDWIVAGYVLWRLGKWGREA